MAENSERQSHRPREGRREEEPNEIEERENVTRPQWLQVFRQAFDKAQREQGEISSRRELGRDRSHTLFLLVGAALAVLVLFMVVFSSPDSTPKRLMAASRSPELGRRMTPGRRASGQADSVAPLLNATPRTEGGESAPTVTAEDVGRTAKPQQEVYEAPPASESRVGTAPPEREGKYALGKINFSGFRSSAEPGCDISKPQAGVVGSGSDSKAWKGLRKPSLVFVRSLSPARTSPNPQVPPGRLEETPLMAELPAGTRLVARLQSAVSTAVRAPVIAAIEDNYEQNGKIVVPAGTLALGQLVQADRSGDVTLDFNALQMPNGATEKIAATAMSLSYGPLRGRLTGKGTAKRFLVRSLTGIGTVAAYLVGAGGGTGFNAPLSESSLLRDRIASNIGMAGDQELNSLAFNQRIVVTIPGNTRFFIVLEKGALDNRAETRPVARVSEARNTAFPTLDELRQLLQLQQEMSELVRPGRTQNVAASERQH